VQSWILHIFAALAEKERSDISAPTKAALRAAKARGVRLGNPRLDEARAAAMAVMKAGADALAARALPLAEALRAEGLTLRQIAARLNQSGWRPRAAGVGSRSRSPTSCGGLENQPRGCGGRPENGRRGALSPCLATARSPCRTSEGRRSESFASRAPGPTSVPMIETSPSCPPAPTLGKSPMLPGRFHVV
jgi:hypothetical protein